MPDDGWYVPHVAGAGSWNRNLPYIINVGSAGMYVAFLRFTNITLVMGETVNSAILTMTVSPPPNGQGGLRNFRIWGEHAVNPPPVTDSIDGSNRIRTTHSKAWNPLCNASLPVDSPDISNIIQEIINLPAWVSGAALQLFIEPVTAPGQYWVGEDGTGQAGRAVLTINGAGGGGGTSVTEAPFWLFEDE